MLLVALESLFNSNGERDVRAAVLHVLLTVLQAVLTPLLPTVRHILEQHGSDADADDCNKLFAILAMLATGLGEQAHSMHACLPDVVNVMCCSFKHTQCRVSL